MTSHVSILVQRAMLKIKSNLCHNSIHITGCCQVQFYGLHVHVGGAKTDFDPLRLYFYTILTIVTSQMAILVQRAILKNESNFFHNSINITECFQMQCFGKHGHVGITKYDFHPPRLYFYTILTLMTSQMAILLLRTILKKLVKKFHNSIHIIGLCQGQFLGNHVYVGRTKK